MSKSKETEIQDCIQVLQANNDLDLVCQSLRYIAHSSDDESFYDDQLYRLVEQYLEDKRVVVFGVPSYYGEIRWVAAEALAALRMDIGLFEETVILENTFTPLSSHDLYERKKKIAPDIDEQVAKHTGLSIEVYRAQPIELRIAQLYDLGYLPTYTRRFSPTHYRRRKTENIIRYLQMHQLESSPSALGGLAAKFGILAYSPVQDKRLIPVLEAFLDDYRLSVSLGGVRGVEVVEIRWAAAAALAALRAAFNIEEKIVLKQAFDPLNTEQVQAIVIRLGTIPDSDQIYQMNREELAAMVEWLRQEGHLPTSTLIFDPSDFIS